MIKCYRIQLESVAKVPRNFAPFLPISSSKTTWLKSLATEKPIASYNTGELFICITNFSFRKAPSFLECTSMLGTLTKTFRLPGLFIPAWMASTPPEKNTITVISCIGHLVCNNLFCNDFSTPFLLKRTIHLRISCI